MEHAVDGSSGCAVFPGELAKAHAALPVPTDGYAIKFQRRASDVLTFKARPPHAGTDSLDDQAAFQFCDGSDDHHYGAAQRAAGIDIFPEADILDPYSVELIKHI